MFCVTAIALWSSNYPHAKAETERLINTDWQEVPSSYSISKDPQFSGSIFIDINNLQVNDRTVIFDAIDVDYSYHRMEIDCQDREIRSLRMGIFLEGSDRDESRIDFSNSKDNWRKIEKPSEMLMKDFVCSKVTNR
jgi:hypothetical protein